MKFFLDTADIAEIKTGISWGIVDGVTTNPSLMAKEGIKGHDAIMQHYKDICEVVDGPVSAEVLGTTFEGIIEENVPKLKQNKTNTKQTKGIKKQITVMLTIICLTI